MIRRDVLHEILKARQEGSYLFPYYGKYSVAEIPQSVLSHFGVATKRPTLPFQLPESKRLLLFFVDGFGFDHFWEFSRYLPFFCKLREKGEVYPLTSVFPSTTPAALTTFHTGLSPEEHGLPEWTVYFEELDTIVETLPFRAHLTPGHDTLLSSHGTPQMLYEGRTVYRQLQDAGVASYVFIAGEYAHSAYSQMTQEGSTVVPFQDAVDLFAKLVDLLMTNKDPMYVFVYWNEVDSIEHAFGPGTPEHRDAAARLSLHLEEKLLNQLDPKDVEDVLFMLSSDHGQTAIRDEEIVYLNEYIDLEQSYAKSPAGKPIFPTGAPHDVFLHIDEAKLPVIKSFLEQTLSGKAEVLSTDEAVSRGLFGFGTATERFKKRIGNLVILPYEGYHVWYRHMPQLYFGQKGIHGGLARAEMLVPFIHAPLGSLITGGSAP